MDKNRLDFKHSLIEKKIILTGRCWYLWWIIKRARKTR